MAHKLKVEKIEHLIWGDGSGVYQAIFETTQGKVWAPFRIVFHEAGDSEVIWGDSAHVDSALVPMGQIFALVGHGSIMGGGAILDEAVAGIQARERALWEEQCARDANDARQERAAHDRYRAHTGARF